MSRWLRAALVVIAGTAFLAGALWVLSGQSWEEVATWIGLDDSGRTGSPAGHERRDADESQGEDASLDATAAVDGGPATVPPLEGRVVNNAGDPIPGAAVALYPDPAMAAEDGKGELEAGACRPPVLAPVDLGEPVTTATSDRDGRFRIVDLPVGRFVLTSRRAPWPIVRADVELGADSSLQITMHPPRRYTGRVVSTSGAPVSSAQIIASTAVGGFAAVTTDPQGQFSFEISTGDRPNGEVTVYADGFVPTRDDLPLSSRIDLLLQKERRVAGTVVRRGRPVDSARAVLTDDGRYARTDHLGRFVFPCLPSTAVELYGWHQGARSERLELNLEDASIEGVVLAIVEPATLAITVIDGDGAPIPAANVRLRGETDVQQAVTDRVGGVTFATVSPGSLLVDVGADGYAETTLPVRILEGGAQEETTVTLSSSHTVRVRVERDGDPLSARGTLVEVADVVQSSSRTSLAEPVVEGWAVFRSVPAGEYTARLLSDTSVADPVSFAVPGASPTLNVDVGETVSGRVIDEGGAPVRGATVELWCEDRIRQAITDQRGQFTIQGLTADPCKLSARGAGYTASTPETVVPSAEELTLELALGFDISGAVLRADGRPGGLYTKVTATPLDAAAEHSVFYAQLRESSRFVFSGVPRGSYSVQARSRTGVSSNVVEAQAGDTELRLQLRPGGGVSGRVEDSEGDPVTGFLAYTENMKDPFLFSRFWDDRGAFEVAELPAGDAVLHIRAEGLKARDVKVQIEEGRVVDLGVIRLEPSQPE